MFKNLDGFISLLYLYKVIHDKEAGKKNKMIEDARCYKGGICPVITHIIAVLSPLFLIIITCLNIYNGENLLHYFFF